MKIYIINLDSQTVRLKFQESQLGNLGLIFQRIVPFRIVDENDPVYEQHYATWQRELNSAEVSCFLSHAECWQKILESREPALILEDDAYLASDLIEVLNEVKILNGIDYLNLEARWPHQKKLVAKTPSFMLNTGCVYRLFQGRSGAAGYILWPKGAAKLLNNIESNGIGLVDKYINESYYLTSYTFEPSPIIQIDQCELYGFEAPITVKTSIPKPPTKRSISELMYWRYLKRRVKAQFIIGINKIRFGGKSVARGVKASTKFL